MDLSGFKLFQQYFYSGLLGDAYSTIKLTNLLTSGDIKIIDKKTRGQPNTKLDGHLSKNILVDGVFINVITPLTIRAVLNDISNAKITLR